MNFQIFIKYKILVVHFFSVRAVGLFLGIGSKTTCLGYKPAAGIACSAFGFVPALLS
jgi:hypothetical protein